MKSCSCSKTNYRENRLLCLSWQGLIGASRTKGLLRVQNGEQNNTLNKAVNILQKFWSIFSGVKHNEK